MFTLPAILNAHSKVKSGADFPSYIKELANLGVNNYQTFVADGATVYYGKEDYKVLSPAKHNALHVAATANTTAFKTALKAHQQGKTNYTDFCNDCAKYGIEKWEVSIAKMTCTYFDKSDNEVLMERIPE